MDIKGIEIVENIWKDHYKVQVKINGCEFYLYKNFKTKDEAEEFVCTYLSDNPAIREAKFVSEWDDGYTITTKCYVNTDEKLVFNIEITDEKIETLEILNREYIIIDGVEYSVSPEKGECEYWYK